MDAGSEERFRAEVNPGRLSFKQVAQITLGAIQRLPRDPAGGLPDDVIAQVLPVVEAEVAAVAARPEAGDSGVLPASVVPHVVDEYLVVRQDWGWPAGRAGVWAVEQVVDRHRALDIAVAAREEGDGSSAAQVSQELGERTRRARMAWADQATQPWLRSDVGSLLEVELPLQLLPTEVARGAGTEELHGWVEEALRSQRPLELEVEVARTAVRRTRSHRDEEALVLHGLDRQLNQTRAWWWPGAWGRRSDLEARIEERQEVVAGLGEQLRLAEEKVTKLMAARMVDLETWQASHRRRVGRAVAAVHELQLREQGLLHDHAVDPPGYLVEAVGPPPSDPAGRLAWQAQTLQLERARAAALAIDPAATLSASSVPPPTLPGPG